MEFTKANWLDSTLTSDRAAIGNIDAFNDALMAFKKTYSSSESASAKRRYFAYITLIQPSPSLGESSRDSAHRRQYSISRSTSKRRGA
jgi:hypothetical protein